VKNLSYQVATIPKQSIPLC